MEPEANALLAALKEPYKEYWLELGRFLHTYAQTESNVLDLLRVRTRVSAKIAGAIFSGTRGGTARDYINRSLDALGLSEEKRFLERPFAQLGVINGVRDNLVHWGAYKVEGTFMVSNAALNPPPGRGRNYEVSPLDLRNMTMDLILISGHLGMACLRPPYETNPMWSFVNRPWHYKPPQQAAQTKKPQKTARSPRRQQGASQE